MKGWGNKILISFLLLGLLSFVTGCKDGITSHNIDQKGVMHGKKLYKGAKNCTACHGIALKGNGWIPSCYNCHDVLWNKDDHKVRRGGILHKVGKPAKVVCAKCHGADLQGGGKKRPSCYSCHQDVWTAVEETHTFKRGSAYHGTKLYKPETNCSSCHGADLKGSGSRPSCYSCHGAKWTQFSDTHSKNIGGKMHQSKPAFPQGRCTECHGADLKGSEVGPSCYSCHGDKWSAIAAVHTKPLGGYQHGAKPYAPTTNCSSCHGTDLKGKNTAPSCFSCHQDLWIKTNHGKNKDGALHGWGYKQPTTYCVDCHGASLTGGTPPEAPNRAAASCYSCHGAKWLGGGD